MKSELHESRGYKIRATLSWSSQRSTYIANLYWPDLGVRRRPHLNTGDKKVALERLQILVSEYLDSLTLEIAGQEKSIDEEEKKEKDSALNDIINWYLHTHIPLNSYAKKTEQKYKHVLMDLSWFCSRNRIGRLQQLSFAKLQEWQLEYMKNHAGRGEEGKHAPRTIQRNLSIVRTMFNAAARAGLIPENPIKYWDIKKDPGAVKDIEPLTRQELNECLDLLKQRSPSIWNVCTFMAYSGIRVSDVMDLRWREVDLDRGFIDRKQIKTKDNLKYPLTKPLIDCIERERDRLGKTPGPREKVFRNASGNPWQYNSVYSRLVKCLKKANFPKSVSCHTFRHTFATLAAHQDPPVPAKVLQNLLGHKNIETTLSYYTGIDEQSLRYWSQRAQSNLSVSKAANGQQETIGPKVLDFPAVNE